MHPFRSDFYGRDMKAIVLGYIRPQLDYTSSHGSIPCPHWDANPLFLAQPGVCGELRGRPRNPGDPSRNEYATKPEENQH